MMRHGVYAAAIARSVAYFLDGVELSGEDVNRQTRMGYEDMLTNEFGILSKLLIIGVDMIGLGNSFTTVHLPLKRMLTCPACGLMRHIAHLKKGVDYRFENFEFMAYWTPKSAVFWSREISVAVVEKSFERLRVDESFRLMSQVREPAAVKAGYVVTLAAWSCRI